MIAVMVPRLLSYSGDMLSDPLILGCHTHTQRAYDGCLRLVLFLVPRRTNETLSLASVCSAATTEKPIRHKLLLA